MIKKHENSSCHREAVELLITLPATRRDVGEMLSTEHQREKQTNRGMLLKIISCVKYLARQGMALRGDGEEENSNFIQALKMREDNLLLLDWIERKRNKYTSPEIQNEILKIMAKHVLRQISNCIQRSPFIAIMIDETTDISNHEQTTVVIRWISESLDVHEDFLGLYQVPSIDSNTLTSVVKDSLCRINVQPSKLRGQCYDGASAMRGARSGVAKQILDLERRAVYTHCYGHSINLAVNDAMKLCKITHEITKLIKHSPRREELFRSLKSEHACIGGTHGVGMRLLCLTRWTVRADALKSVMENYDVLQSTWDEALSIVKDTEGKARIIGVASQMETFDFFFWSISW